ncbi:MAG: hypothetical protein LBK25_03775 [Treponema sp.]|nr:hypothetical protein [Treponema sp.]
MPSRSVYISRHYGFAGFLFCSIIPLRSIPTPLLRLYSSPFADKRGLFLGRARWCQRCRGGGVCNGESVSEERRKDQRARRWCQRRGDRGARGSGRESKGGETSGRCQRCQRCQRCWATGEAVVSAERAKSKDGRASQRCQRC